MSNSMNLIFESMDLQYASVSAPLILCLVVCKVLSYDLSHDCHMSAARHSQQVWDGVPGALLLRLAATPPVLAECPTRGSEGSQQRSH